MAIARGLSRREFMRSAAAGAVGLFGVHLLTACTAPQPAASPAPVATGSPAAGVPKKGGTLRAAQLYDITPRQPHSITENNQMFYAQLMDTVLWFDHDMKPQPGLAESWEFSKDFKTLTLKMRKGVRFHSGREFEANDVIRNIKNTSDPQAGSQMGSQAALIADMQAPDKQTLVLTFKQPSPSMLDLFETLYIIDMDGIADVTGGKKVVGTGPFQWGEWRPGESFTAKRFDGYWKGPAPLDGFEIQVAKDSQGVLVSLESGAIDLAVNPLESEIPRLKKNKDLSVLISESGNQWYYVGINVANKPVDNKLVRQGINYAINRQRLVDTILGGVGEVTASAYPKGSPAYDAEAGKRYAFDLDKAKALFKEANLAEGTEILIQPTNAHPAMVSLAEMMNADLAKIGVNLKVDVLDRTTWTSNLQKKQFTHTFTGAMGFWNMYPTTPLIQAFPVRVGNNASNYTDPKYKELVDAATVETDPAKQKALFKQLSDLMLDECFNLPVTPNKRAWATRAYVKGLDYSAYDRVVLGKVWLDK